MSSILLRRKRQHNPHNDTSLDSQWDRDQRRLEARRAATAQRNAGILGRLHNDPKQKERERQVAADELQAYMTRVKEEATKRKELEAKVASEIAQRENDLIQKDSEKIETKRQCSAKMMEQNRKLCEFRYEQRLSQAAQEKSEDATLVDNHFMMRFGTSLN